MATAENRQQHIRIGAALFNGDHARLADEVARLEAAGVDFIHFDFFDGHFVPVIGFPIRTIAALRPLTKLPFEVHVGVLDPLKFVPHLAEAGAERLLIHLEAMMTPYETLYSAREHGPAIGVALTLGTPLVQVEPVLLLVDSVLLLSRVTGEGSHGAEFSPLVYSRIETLRSIAVAETDIQVAGGLNKDHVAKLAKLGATSLAFGGGLYRVPDMAAEVAAMLERARGE
jgi:ribulose-phosphate 3-epimerase